MSNSETLAMAGSPCGCPNGPATCNQPFCPYLQATFEIIGRRWTGAILRAMLSGLTRFSDLRDTIPDISDRMLSERLKELEADGLVERTVIPATPVRIAYALTPKGNALERILDAALVWADTWLERTP